jgi:hypothetical protein
LQVSNLCSDKHWWSVWGQICFSKICLLNFLSALQPTCLEWSLCFQEALLFMLLLISRSKYDHVSFLRDSFWRPWLHAIENLQCLSCMKDKGKMIWVCKEKCPFSRLFWMLEISDY